MKMPIQTVINDVDLWPTTTYINVGMYLVVHTFQLQVMS